VPGVNGKNRVHTENPFLVSSTKKNSSSKNAQHLSLSLPSHDRDFPTPTLSKKAFLTRRHPPLSTTPAIIIRDVKPFQDHRQANSSPSFDSRAPAAFRLSAPAAATAAAATADTEPCPSAQSHRGAHGVASPDTAAETRADGGAVSQPP